MKEILVKDVLRLTNGKLIIGNEEEKLENFSKDTRIINKDDVYIAIKGGSFDGNKFWKEALEKGAKIVIVQDIDFGKEDLSSFDGKTIIEVDDTLEALYKIAEYKRSLYNIPVIGVTGSVGKTSTKDIIASVVSQKYKTLKTEGNNNNNIGLPFTILRLKDEEAAVIEMGMNHLREISLLTKIAKPTISVITNIGTSHIGNLGSRENILKAKLEILEGMEKPLLVINNDNDMLHRYYEENMDKLEMHTYGIENESDVMAKNIVTEQNSSIFESVVNGEKIGITVPVGGNHFVLNSLCACKIGELLNIDNSKIKQGIEKFELTNKRMDITELENGITVINDAYNASFESMQASLNYLANLSNPRKIAFLGDMFELGEFSKELHEKVGKVVAKNDIDILICVGENAKYIYNGAVEAGKNENAYYFGDKQEALEFLKNIIKAKDVVIFKASNGMRFFDLAEKFNV